MTFSISLVFHLVFLAVVIFENHVDCGGLHLTLQVPPTIPGPDSADSAPNSAISIFFQNFHAMDAHHKENRELWENDSIHEQAPLPAGITPKTYLQELKKLIR